VERSQDRTESSKKWSGVVAWWAATRTTATNRADPDEKDTEIGRRRTRTLSILRNPSGETGEWTPQEFGMRGRGGVMRPHE
jgi:hypothetical protein